MHRVGPATDRLRRVSLLFAFGLLGLAALPASAQPLPEEARKAGDRLRAAFSPVASEARESTVRVYSDGEPASLGVIVSERGHVLTKASQLHGEITVRLGDGAEETAEVVRINWPSDLALVKVPMTGLTPVRWADGEPAVGAWLVSVGLGKSPVGVGVVSVAPREIAPHRPMLGIELARDTDLPRISGVIPNSSAATAGLQVGDVITAVAGETVSTRQALLDRLTRFRPGEPLPLIVRRGEKEEEVLATLGSELTVLIDRQARQNMMAGPLSIRSGGFDGALQHDTVLRPEDCGGPIVDLSGRVVGLNIARAGRVESYALPADTVRPILAELMSESMRTANK